MQNEPFQLRCLPLFEQDLLDTVDYITNVLQNEDAVHCTSRPISTYPVNKHGVEN